FHCALFPEAKAVAPPPPSPAAPKVITISSSLCSSCNKTSRYRCSHCRTVAYCSRLCQSAHWSQHKPHCQTSAIVGVAAGAGVDAVSVAASLDLQQWHVKLAECWKQVIKCFHGNAFSMVLE